MHLHFKIWFVLCLLNLVSLMIIGIFRHCLTNYADGKNKWVTGIYYLFSAWWLGMWVYGLHVRFQDSGRAVCNKNLPCDNAPLDATSEPCMPNDISEAEIELLQVKSCNFMKFYLDIAGLLIGGYAAWFILGLTGATKTPVWTPKIPEDDKDKVD